MKQQIVEHCKALDTRFYGLTLKSLRFLADNFAEQNGIPHWFNNTTQLAGTDWTTSEPRPACEGSSNYSPPADTIPLPKIITKRKCTGRGLKFTLLTGTPSKERLVELDAQEKKTNKTTKQDDFLITESEPHYSLQESSFDLSELRSEEERDENTTELCSEEFAVIKVF
ncbi:hypothetical protein ILUMI_02139 [Ignelater luminosus]|uniref:Uncharacterized protein n=1 Tax=Ignelater luminosus TaxID=2038154 RepID=A0A8K0DIT8_IGNLU|nr:hypothetical protein ILUMI_02139 [Ignelater luminosus]